MHDGVIVHPYLGTRPPEFLYAANLCLKRAPKPKGVCKEVSKEVSKELSKSGHKEVSKEVSKSGHKEVSKSGLSTVDTSRFKLARPSGSKVTP